MKKLEQTRREAEDKVSYLLQQLRNAEGKINNLEIQNSPQTLDIVDSRIRSPRSVLLGSGFGTSLASTGSNPRPGTPKAIRRMTDTGLSSSILNFQINGTKDQGLGQGQGQGQGQGLGQGLGRGQGQGPSLCLKLP